MHVADLIAVAYDIEDIPCAGKTHRLFGSGLYDGFRVGGLWFAGFPEAEVFQYLFDNLFVLYVKGINIIFFEQHYNRLRLLPW